METFKKALFWVLVYLSKILIVSGVLLLCILIPMIITASPLWRPILIVAFVAAVSLSGMYIEANYRKYYH